MESKLTPDAIAEELGRMKWRGRDWAVHRSGATSWGIRTTSHPMLCLDIEDACAIVLGLKARRELVRWDGYNVEQVKRILDERIIQGRMIMDLEAQLTAAREELAAAYQLLQERRCCIGFHAGQRCGNCLNCLEARVFDLRDELVTLRADREGLEREVAGYRAGRCPICDWPLKLTVEEGCTFNNCGYRPEAGSDEYKRIQKRRDALTPHGRIND